jgi:hypothetical protein
MTIEVRHLAPPDFDPAPLREMFRTTLAGEPMGRAEVRGLVR